MSDGPEADDAYAALRAHTSGELRFEEHVRPIRYVIAPDGRLVAPVTYAMLDAYDTVLFVPEFAEGALEVQVTLSALDPEGSDGGLTDRWRIYHGEPRDARWAILEIDAARYHEWVVDGEALMRPNDLAGVEAEICRLVNGSRRADLAAACRRAAGADVEDPRLVGVDPLGFDVRRRHDVIRIPAPAPMNGADEARRTLQRMIGDP